MRNFVGSMGSDLEVHIPLHYPGVQAGITMRDVTNARLLVLLEDAPFWKGSAEPARLFLHFREALLPSLTKRSHWDGNALPAGLGSRWKMNLEACPGGCAVSFFHGDVLGAWGLVGVEW